MVGTRRQSPPALAWQLVQEFAAGGCSFPLPQNQAEQRDSATVHQRLTRLRVKGRQFNRHAGERAPRAERVAHSRGFHQAVEILNSYLVSHGTHHELAVILLLVGPGSQWESDE